MSDLIHIFVERGDLANLALQLWASSVSAVFLTLNEGARQWVARPLVEIEARGSSRHRLTKSAHCRGFPTGVCFNQTAIAGIVRRHTTGAIGDSVSRFKIAYSTMNSVVAKCQPEA